MNALELADELERLYQQDIIDGVADLSMPEAATMLRQQQAEIEALKMGFANSGTHDSELAETRAMAGRLFLKVQDLEFEREGYENLTEMLESEKAELTEKNCQQQAEIGFYKQDADKYKQKCASQQAEIEALKKEKWLTEIDCKQQVLKQIIDMLTIHHDTLACSSYPMSKENRVKKLQEEYADVFKNHWSEQQ